jgi:hypothetical protein
MAPPLRLVTIALPLSGDLATQGSHSPMKRVLCTIALSGVACAAGAHLPDASGPAKSFAGQDGLVVSLQAYPAGAHSFNDVLADASANTPRTDSRIAAGTASWIPEPQTYALLLAGLGAIIFVAVRRSRP